MCRAVSGVAVNAPQRNAVYLRICHIVADRKHVFVLVKQPLFVIVQYMKRRPYRFLRNLRHLLCRFALPGTFHLFAPRAYPLHTLIVVFRGKRQYRLKLQNAPLVIGQPSAFDAAFRQHFDLIGVQNIGVFIFFL